MIENMVQALKDKQMAELEFDNARTDEEIDIAIHKLAIAGLRISAILKKSKEGLNV